MSEMKSANLQQVQAEIAAKDPNIKKGRSLSNAKNLTAKNDLSQVKPTGGRILVTLKSWPAQSASGIFVPDSYTVIRGDKYIGEVYDTGNDVTLVKKGDIVIFSMFSGHHVTTKSGHAKILDESNILLYKEGEIMGKDSSYDPVTFKPGINHMLVEVFKRGEEVTEGGILVERGDDAAFSGNDAVTKSGRVLSIGETNEWGKTYSKTGDVIIFEDAVGLDVNTNDITDVDKYKLMLGQHALATISD